MGKVREKNAYQQLCSYNISDGLPYKVSGFEELGICQATHTTNQDSMHEVTVV